MRSHRAASDILQADPRDFSFVLGGPLFQLLRRARLSGDALELAHRRILFLAGFTWVPLLVLSILGGRAAGGSVAVPFLRDLDVHVRFLLVVPLLVAAELVVHLRIRGVARQFLDRGLISAADQSRFDAALASTMRLRNSVAAELALLVFVYVVGIQVVWRGLSLLGDTTWYATPDAGGMRLSLAGVWFAYISLPFSQFLLMRWYYRIFLWTRFLWKASRIELRLVPTHPDRVGGLGFLSLTPYAFQPLAVAHGALLAGWIASRIFLQQAGLRDFTIEIVVVAVLMLCLVFGPLLLFWPQISQAWRQGEHDYGPLAARQAQAFDDKWVRGTASTRDALLGSPDPQSLAHMTGVYTVVRTMGWVPVTRMAIIQLLVATLAPVAPLVLTMMPLGRLLERLAGMVF